MCDQNSSEYEEYDLPPKANRLQKQAEEAWRAHLIKDLAEQREERRRREKQTS